MNELDTIKKKKDATKIALICMVIFLIIVCSIASGAALAYRYAEKTFHTQLFNATKVGGIYFDSQTFDIQLRTSNVNIKPLAK
jgi:uncharacterized protein YpmB